MGRFNSAERVLVTLLYLNPADNQGARDPHRRPRTPPLASRHHGARRPARPQPGYTHLKLLLADTGPHRNAKIQRLLGYDPYQAFDPEEFTTAAANARLHGPAL
ncbi:hypothetical protein [Streptomyces sp. NPDC002845]